MMAAPGTVIVLTAGGVTFAGEWYWSHKIDWKVPLATVILGAAFEGLSAVDRNGATILAIMVFAGAASTKYNGHSAFDMVTNLIGGGKTKNQKTSATNPPDIAAQHAATTGGT